ncbi:regulatory protein RecX [Natranaerobius trueperi]|uniref:Regulatory protein RecX n=1 Tax=Natranaerobius trueperi TaxID=759412 RepID=A0A226BVW6_9FIRM|nr:regulatory protein RecX [Natranaerobius trueperi]OWZ83115.1 hypothetical protein CDO51_10465 [Natranaerobius trueperi]
MSDSDTVDQFHGAYSRAIKFMTHRQKTTKEMRDYLLKKGYDLKIVEKVINRLYEFDFLNDYNFAKEYVYSKVFNTNTPIGPKRIRLELKHKGIDKEIIDKIVNDISHEEEMDLAKKLICKKNIEIVDLKVKRKLAVYLERRGFSEDAILKLLNIW